jgi:tetratricopeptide (TPR) repeat protein
MVESRRAESSGPLEAADRDSRAELLLVEGLDRYFEGRYDDAIHLWTRVLFLDRSHARARAYIARARTALAEHQRRAEELLQASQDLIEQGRAADARDLLTKAVEASGDDARSESLRVKLERLERAARATAPMAGAAGSAPSAPALPGWRWPRRSRTLAMTAAVTTLAVASVLTISLGWPSITTSPQDRLAVSTTTPRWPVLSSSDVALVRARTLYSHGQLPEALQALNGVNASSAARADADRLRIEIQRVLLSGAATSTKAGGR